jgi:hypothetical protein
MVKVRTVPLSQFSGRIRHTDCNENAALSAPMKVQAKTFAETLNAEPEF